MTRKIQQPSTSADLRFDPVEAYCSDVLEGRTLAGKFVRLACERHRRDRELGPKRGLKWELDNALWVINFFAESLKLHEGEFAGQPFILERWEQFVVGSLFGWLGPDGYRRFRTGYIEIGKGNGKSPLAGGIGLYMMAADGEAGAECYAAAPTLKQANILFGDAVNMVDASPTMSARVVKSGKMRVFNLAHLPSGSFFRPVSAERRGLDGPRVHYAALDEVHEHASPLVVQKIDAGTKGRRQALILEITNSGYDRESICYHHHEYSRKILEGNAENDSWFAYVCQLDDGDDWRDPKVWTKANPNLGVSVTHEYLSRQVRKALDIRAEENTVKRLNFCIWTEQSTRAIPMEQWDACNAAVEVDADELCYPALDLASRLDKAACVLVFPPRNGRPWRVIPHFWVPAAQVEERLKRGDATYDNWVKGKFLNTTPGNTIDFDQIRRAISGTYFEDGVQKYDPECLNAKYNFAVLEKDPWNSTQIGTQLGETDGLKVEDFDQNMRNYTAPTKELLASLASKTLAHGGHPVLRADAANFAVMQDGNGNLKPDRKTSGGSIDGIAGLLMGMGPAMLEIGPSVYESRGVIVI